MSRKPDVFVPSDASIKNETLHHFLGIDDKQNNKFAWMIEELAEKGTSIGESMQKLSAMEISNEERVYIGYMLCKYIVVKKTPGPLRGMLNQIYQL